MNRSEIILLSLTILFFFLGLIPIPGGAVFLLLSLSALASYYYLFGFAVFSGIRLKNIFKKATYRETNIWQIIGSVFTGFLIGVGIIGTMFKIQIWPGANVILIVATTLLAIVTIIAFIKYGTTKRPFYRRLLIRTSIAIVIFTLAFFTSAMTYFSIKNRRNPLYIEAMKLHLQNPTPETWKEVQKRRFTDEKDNPIEYQIEEEN